MSRGSKKGCCHAKRYHCCHLQFNVSWDILWALDTRTLSQVWNRKWKEKHKVLKVDSLTRCNKTSKIGTTAPGVVSKPESYLEGFGTEPLRDSSFACAKKLSCESEHFKTKLRKIWQSKIWNVHNERENSEWTSTNTKHHSWTVAVEPLLCVLILKHFGQLQWNTQACKIWMNHWKWAVISNQEFCFTIRPYYKVSL